MIIGFRRIYFPWSLSEDVGQDHLGKFHHDQTLFSRSLEMMVYSREIIPFYGRTIQVSELLGLTQNHDFLRPKD